jgi:plastocyanin
VTRGRRIRPDRAHPTAAVLAALAVAGTVGLAGCGGPRSDRTVEITARFSKFTPAQVDVAPGTTVRFVVHNADPIAHELIVGDAGVHERHEEGTEPWHPPRPGEVSIPAGESRATTFTVASGLAPGQVVEFGCHLPGHWAYGMRGTLVVA